MAIINDGTVRVVSIDEKDLKAIEWPTHADPSDENWFEDWDIGDGTDLEKISDNELKFVVLYSYERSESIKPEVRLFKDKSEFDIWKAKLSDEYTILRTGILD